MHELFHITHNLDQFFLLNKLRLFLYIYRSKSTLNRFLPSKVLEMLKSPLADCLKLNVDTRQHKIWRYSKRLIINDGPFSCHVIWRTNKKVPPRDVVEVLTLRCSLKQRISAKRVLSLKCGIKFILHLPCISTWWIGGGRIKLTNFD